MAHIDLSTTLPAPADAVWAAVRTPGAFRLVTRHLLSLPAIRRRRAPWREGEVVEGWLFLLGVIPFSRHRLHVEVIDDGARHLSTRERGGMIRTWDHQITVEPIDGSSCRYRDVIRIDAGIATPVVAAWARIFYRIRQRRWRELATALAPAAEAIDGARDQMQRHEAAFNAGTWGPVMEDYATDAVLEVIVGDERTVATGRDQIREALEAASAWGIQTRAVGVAANEGAIAAVIDDEDGRPFLASIWVLRDGRIARDVSVVLDPTGTP
jgi:hypothetical protein